MVPFQIVSTIVFAVLAGPLLCGGSIAWAQSAYRLVGTIEGGPFTGAVIDDTKNPQAFYRLNDKLPDESRLVKVLHNRIVLKLPDGTSMELYATSGTGGGSVSAAPVAAVPSVAPQQINRQNPDVQNAQVQDPPKRRVSSKERRSRSRSIEED